MGFSVYPDTKMDERRMVEILRRYGLDRMVVNSAADWGNSDPLKTVRVAEAMLAGGFSDDDVDRVLWRNPVEFYSQSGRLELPETQGPGESGESAASAASDEAGAPSEPVEPGQSAPSGRLVGASTGTAATFMGNSVLRGARD
jgi:hypothetical protein